jgi:hypothetical protein
MTLQYLKTIQRRSLVVVNNEWKECGKRSCITWKYYTDIFLDGMIEIKKYHRIAVAWAESEWMSPSYKSDVFIWNHITQQRQVISQSLLYSTSLNNGREATLRNFISLRHHTQMVKFDLSFAQSKFNSLINNTGVE